MIGPLSDLGAGNGMAFQFPVEAGRILSFARSVGDLRYASAAQLDAAPGTVLTVPPTFVQSGGGILTPPPPCTYGRQREPAGYRVEARTHCIPGRTSCRLIMPTTKH